MDASHRQWKQASVYFSDADCFALATLGLPGLAPQRERNVADGLRALEESLGTVRDVRVTATRSQHPQSGDWLISFDALGCDGPPADYHALGDADLPPHVEKALRHLRVKVPADQLAASEWGAS